MYIHHAALCPLSSCPSRAARPTLAAQGRIPVVKGFICWCTLIGVSFLLSPSTQVLLGFGVLFIIFGVTGISIRWQKEWPTVPLSLRVGSPSYFHCVGGVWYVSTSVSMSVCHLPHRPRLRFCSLVLWEHWLFWAHSSLRASMQPKQNVGLFSASPSLSVISQWWLPCSCHFRWNKIWMDCWTLNGWIKRWMELALFIKTKCKKSCKHRPTPWWQMSSEAPFIYWLFWRSVCKCLLLTCSCVNNKRGLSHCVDFSPGSKFFIVVVPLAVSAAIFLCPLYIQTQCPCLTEQLPKKPDLIGHRGAPMVSRTTFSPTTRGHACRRHAGHRFVTTSPPLPLNQEEVIYTV